MRIAGYRPRNTYLHRQLDRRWRRWLIFCGAGAGAIAVLLGGIVGPRQATVRLRYEIAQVKSEVEALKREHRALLLALEAETSPHTLAQRASELGLTRVPPQRLLFLTPSGKLIGGPASSTNPDVLPGGFN